MTGERTATEVPVSKRVIPPRRLGKLTISRELLVNEWPSLLQVFARFVPVSCNANFVTDSLHYVGFSSDFEVIEQGIEPPEYGVELQSGANGKAEFVRFIRV